MSIGTGVGDREARAAQMEQAIRTYFEGCNEADAEKMIGCFVPDGVHYFPPGMYGGPWRDAETIARSWQHFHETLGSRWTIEKILCDPDRNEAVIEWTHWKTKQGSYLRGDEWYVFDADTGLIQEIRAYYASPAARDLPHLELEGFGYAERGYALEPPSQ